MSVANRDIKERRRKFLIGRRRCGVIIRTRSSCRGSPQNSSGRLMRLDVRLLQYVGTPLFKGVCTGHAKHLSRHSRYRPNRNERTCCNLAKWYDGSNLFSMTYIMPTHCYNLIFAHSRTVCAFHICEWSVTHDLPSDVCHCAISVS